MYKYSDQNAETYSKLGIVGTTYESGFNEARKIFGDLTGKTALDFGTGAGRTAQLLLSMNASKVIGVDHNQSMIDQARKLSDPKLEFVKIDKVVPFPDNTFDAAIAAHVFVEVSSIDEMKQISSEVYRILKPGSSFVIITNNSKAIGCNYISFGYPKNDNLKSGDKMPCTIKRDKDSFVIDDYYWTEDDYRNVLRKIGFSVSMTFPLMSGDNWLDEAKIASHVVINAVK